MIRIAEKAKDRTSKLKTDQQNVLNLNREKKTKRNKWNSLKNFRREGIALSIDFSGAIKYLSSKNHKTTKQKRTPNTLYKK